MGDHYHLYSTGNRREKWLQTSSQPVYECDLVTQLEEALGQLVDVVLHPTRVGIEEVRYHASGRDQAREEEIGM